MKIFQPACARAHPRRMLIVRLLCEIVGGEFYFGKLQAKTDIRQSSLRHHLREMERGWLITRQRRGQEVYYKLSPDSLLHSMDRLFEI